ncbi:MAG: extracellular solute-binding protein, partial [Burkholderiaceae bacterium]
MLIFPATLRRHLLALGAATLAVTAWPSALAQSQTLNIYSARHYQTDEALYADFTKTTGIKINRVDADDAGILARLKSEGSNSPADLILLVDAARLWRAEVDGLFQPVNSKLLKDKIPAHLRGKEEAGASQWFGFSTRARVIVYNKQTVKPGDVDSYESLAAPVNKGKVCTRSGSHPYNLSLFGSVMVHFGEAATKEWLTGMVRNNARSPQGGDTDQRSQFAAPSTQ